MLCPTAPTQVEQYYWPTCLSSTLFELSRDGLPIAGQKYTIILDFTLFETDKPPPDPDGSHNYRTDLWRPGDGKNYRPLLERTLTSTDQ